MQRRNVLRKIAFICLMGACAALVLGSTALAQAKVQDPLPSWNEGPAKQAILSFVQKVTDKSNPAYVPPAERIATFDQDGTLWVEQPLYTQAMFALDRVHELGPQHPEWKAEQPFKAVLGNDREARGQVHRAGLGTNHWGHPRRHDHRGVSEDHRGVAGSG